MRVKISNIQYLPVRQAGQISNYERLVLWASIGVFVLVFTWIGVEKLHNFQYNGIDFAIFNQTFWNTAHGQPFGLTIHPHSYLGDHAEWVILLLAPIYAILPRPETLIFLQALVLGLTAWAVWRLTKATRAKDPRLPLLLGLLWLANPFVHNMALNEWHGLPFALPLLFLALDAYFRDQRFRFWVFSLLALLVREDVAILFVGFGIFAVYNAVVGATLQVAQPLRLRGLKTRDYLAVIAIAFIAFFVNQKIISHFAVGGAYKFGRFYGWIFQVSSPMDVVRHLATYPNLEMIIGFLLPFAFLPIFGPSALILTLPALAQIMLGTGGGALVFQFHYATLFLPGLVLGTVFGYERLRAWPGLHGLFRDTAALPILLTTATLYTMLTLGPLPHLRAQTEFSDRRVLFNLLREIPGDASVASSYATLVPLSGRREFYSLHYLAQGTTQYGAAPFPRVTPDFIVLDTQDFITYALQMSSWHPRARADIGKNLQDLFERGHYGVVGTAGSVVVLGRNVAETFRFPHISGGGLKTSATIGGAQLLDCPYPNCQSQYLRVTWAVREKLTGDIALQIGDYMEQIGFGISPPSAWEPGTEVVTEHFLPMNLQIKKIQPVEFAGKTVLSGIRNVAHEFHLIKFMSPAQLVKRNKGDQ